MRAGRLTRRMWCGVFALLLSLALVPAALAQTDPLQIPRDLPVSLIADTVTYDTVTETLTAEGSVEVYYGDRTLTADRIVYDRAKDIVTATGRIALRNPDGSTLYAESAELDPQLRDGIIRSARAVLAQRFKIAAVEAQRIGGRYNVLGKAVFSNCEVCAEKPTPLWQIRAARVVHDELEKQIFYEDAEFDALGIPVFYLPYFRHPDPTVERMSGFLVPEVESSDTIGYGLRVPYFYVIDDQSDATVAPFITTGKGLVLEGEYRRWWADAKLRLGGFLTYDEEVNTAPLRGMFDGEGHVWLADDIFARADIRLVSDDAFLSVFDYSDEDRLTSEAAIASYRRDGYWELGAAYVQSLRDDESKGSIPFALPEFDLRQNFDGGPLGGSFTASLNSVALKRSAGADMLRLSGGLGWERSWLTRQGIWLRGFAEAEVDAFRVWDSALGNGVQTRFTPTIGVEARYPFIRQTDSATHIVEPIVQLIWSEPTGDQRDLPNEDSLLVEFDETNLFDTSRFAGEDREEPGFRANLGLRYERIDADGWSLGLVAGRVLRTEAKDVFEDVPGLSGAASDYVAAVTLKFPPYVTLINRVLADDDFSLGRNELRLDLAFDPVTLSGSYLHLARDVQAGALTDRTEATVQAGWQMTEDWSVASLVRYDLEAERFVRAGGTLTYGNECLEVDFSVTRRFTRFDRLDASTTFGLQVRLAGLGSDLNRDRRTGACMRIAR